MFIRLTAILGLAFAAAFAQMQPGHAETVTGQLSADNRFRINLSYGSGQTTTVATSNTNCCTVEDVTFDIDTTRLATCSVQIVAWDEGDAVMSTRAGLIGFLSGNAGTVATGSSVISAYNTNVLAPSLPSPSSAHYEAWIAAANGPASIVHPLIQANWGSMAFLGFTNPPSNMTWIWTDPWTMFQADHYNSFVIPCAALVTDTPSGPFDDDHFACYEPVKKQAPTPETELLIRDQFGEAGVVIGDPVLLCNPAEKHHNQDVFPIRNKSRHLACYEVIKQAPVYPPAVTIENQIETNEFAFDQNKEVVCVPTKKEHL